MEQVAIYYRVSTDEQEVSNQIKMLEDYCISNKYEYTRYGDPGETGTSFKNRPQFLKMLKECGVNYIQEYDCFALEKVKPKYSKIICKSSSRFARNLDCLKILDLLAKNKVYVIFLEDNATTEDINDPTAQLMLGLNALINRNFSVANSQRVHNGMISAAKRGRILTPSTIYGYKLVNNKLYIVPKEAEVVRWIYNEYINGKGYTAISNALNKQGIRTRKGNLWHPQAIFYILTNPKYKGTSARNVKKRSKLTQDTSPTIRPQNEWVIIERGQVLDNGDVFNSIQPIITPQLYAEVQRIRLNKVGTQRGAWRGKDIFVTKLTCMQCHKHFVHEYFKSGDKSTEYYRCQTKKRFGVKMCASPNVPKSTIIDILTNDYINEVVFRLKGRILQHYDLKLANIMESISNNTTNRIDQLQEVNKSLKEQNMKVLDLYLNNQISKDMFTTKQDELNNQIVQNEQELQLLQTPLLEKRGALDEIKNKIKQVKTMSINNNYTPQEIYNMVEQIKVYTERYLTINIRINNILFEDDTKYYF